MEAKTNSVFTEIEINAKTDVYTRTYQQLLMWR
jgi:hypothetical protein